MAKQEFERWAALDARMVRSARGMNLLNLVSWPARVQDAFLAQLRAGKPQLPRHEYPQHDFGEARREMDAIVAEADASHPVGRYLAESAQSWGLAAQLLEALGTSRAGELSQQLFGRPDEPLPGAGPSTREAARHFIGIAGQLDRELLAPEEQVPISATALRLQLQGDLDDYFNGRVIEVVLDPDLIAKAAAGSTRIRLRTGAAFSDYDRHQLLAHEAFVHSLTALNGRQQPVLQSMALSSPRTTATQEGLATFAEQITGAIDIERMKRVSLRIEAVAMAIDGADFLQVFEYFREAGQDEVESFASAQRVFRGVPVEGGAAFAKDVVYLRGLVGVHTFFRWALKHEKLHLCRQLFAGKMTLGDALRFEPLFPGGAGGDAPAGSGDAAPPPLLAPPRWLPRWIARANGLAGMLAFSLFANRIRMDQLDAPIADA